jgi:hypothetical protein
MAGTKFGGRPVVRAAPKPGQRVHLSLAVPQELKRKIEKAAEARGWSVSVEAAHRLESSFERQGLMREILKLAHGDEWGEFFASFHEQGRLKFKKGGTARLRKRMNQFFDSLEESER